MWCAGKEEVVQRQAAQHLNAALQKAGVTAQARVGQAAEDIMKASATRFKR